MPVNLKDQDAFHLTIEEYLHALISLIEELVRSITSVHQSWADRSAGTLSSQFCDTGRLWKAFADQPICEGPARRFSDPQPEE